MNDTPPPMPAYGPPPPPPPAPQKRRAGLIAGAAIAVAAITATSLVIVNPGDDESGSTTAAESTPSDSTVTAGAEPEPESTEPEILGLTDPVTYLSGVEVTLSDYKRGTSSPYASPTSTPYVSFTVKVVNGSNSTVDLGTGYVMCYYGDDSAESEQIFDDGLDGLPSMYLRPGRKASARMACEMPKDEEYLQIEMAPDMDSAVAVLAGNVK